MRVASFVGAPDWRSALLAAAMALPWVLLLSRGWLRRPWLWLGAALGAALFPFSIAWIQVPAQRALGGLWQRLLAPEAIQRYLLPASLPSLLAASLIQEGTKLLVAAGALRILHERRSARAGLAAGAAAGAGYGGLEAFWVFNLIFGQGWSWATVQLMGPQALLGFVERLFAVPFHVGTAALAAYGLATGRPWRFLLAAIGLHTLANYAVPLLQARVLGVAAVEAWAAVVAAFTMGAVVWLRRRTRPTPEQAG